LASAVKTGGEPSSNLLRRLVERAWIALSLLALLALPGPAAVEAQGGRSPHGAAPIRIELDRSACFGSCPDYRLIIEGSGLVTYEGRGSVLVPGRLQWRIDPVQVSALARRFEAAGFFGLGDSYRGTATDGPTYVLTFALSGRSGRVVDYLGEQAGMPAVVTELERLVDDVGESRRGVEGDAGTVEAMRAAGWNFQSPEAAAAMIVAAATGKPEIVRELHAAGVPALARVREMTAVEAAARGGHSDIFQFLVSSGALTEAGVDLPRRIADAAVTSGNVNILRALMPFRFDQHAGRTPLLNDAMGTDCERIAGCDRPAVIRLLLASGANPNHPNGHGSTALHFAQTVEEARLLVEAGADVNARNDEDETPAMVMYQDWEDIVLYLLDAGADPRIRSVHGETLADKARNNGWRRVSARLSVR
jgi:ankyrin repeat protein